MASALDRLGRFEQAENEYSTALKLSPNDPKIWNDAGYSFYLQGRWTDAERALKTAAKLDPNNTRIMTNLGLNLLPRARATKHSPSSPRPADKPSDTPTSLISWPRWAIRPRPRNTTRPSSSSPRSKSPGKPDRAAARTAYEARIAATSRPPTATAPLLINQPGVLPVAAVRQPPPAATPLVAQAPAATAHPRRSSSRAQPVRLNRRRQSRLKLNPPREFRRQSGWIPLSSTDRGPGAAAVSPATSAYADPRSDAPTGSRAIVRAPRLELSRHTASIGRRQVRLTSRCPGLPRDPGVFRVCGRGRPARVCGELAPRLAS